MASLRGFSSIPDKHTNPITLELCAQLNEAFSEPVMHLQNKHRETVNQLLIIKTRGTGSLRPPPLKSSPTASMRSE